MKRRIHAGQRPFYTDSHWTVIAEGEARRYESCLRRTLVVRCDCGTIATVDIGALSTGKSKSCGCVRNQQTRTRKTSHGESATSMYNCWQAMKYRCSEQFQRRTGTYLGVRHCDAWATYEGFLQNQPAGRPYTPGLVLARYGDTGDYTPKNTRWATPSENSRDVVERIGRRTSTGELVVDAARRMGISPGTAHQRISAYGWTVDDAVAVPVNAKFRRKAMAR